MIQCIVASEVRSTGEGKKRRCPLPLKTNDRTIVYRYYDFRVNMGNTWRGQLLLRRKIKYLINRNLKSVEQVERTAEEFMLCLTTTSGLYPITINC